MQIDWFTLTAQIINFLILLFLLNRFLFKPVMGIMQKREQNIAERIERAEQKEREAEEEAERYRQKQEDFKKRRDDEILAAEEEAKEIKQQAVREAKEEARKLREQWEEALQRDKEEFLSRLRGEVGQEVCDTSKAVLAELANEEMERRIVDTFLQRFSDMDDEELGKIKSDSEKTDQKVVIVTAFGIAKEQKQQLEKKIKKALANSNVQFRTDGELICGIEMRTGGHLLRWSIEGYLDELKERFGEKLTAASPDRDPENESETNSPEGKQQNE